ncbi:hypothetical protein [Amycolatopsis sp. NPDC051102]|uniref:hypothetical protein n=1 Tax=Amycolatopsis sp. NPDC051102 TaxID=3155163 RepID=UPI003449FEFF
MVVRQSRRRRQAAVHRRLGAAAAGYAGIACTDSAAAGAPDCLPLPNQPVEYRHPIDTLLWQGRCPPARDVANADVLDWVLDESQRLWHNVLAAMATRVAQLRRFIKHNFDADAPIATEYHERVGALFAGDVTAAFLHKLRNVYGRT